MYTIDEVQEMLDEIAEAIPAEYYRELNGGVLLIEDLCTSPFARSDDLFTMGQYIRSSSMGRYIKIFYGSFMRVFGHLDRDGLKRELDKTLKHELTHHWESLAGEDDLEKQDAAFMNRYLGG
jgi:hypothetical protein